MILVTGGAGLVGSTLIQQLLQNGYTVKALYNKSAIKIVHPNLTVVKADILDVYALQDAMQNITQVYHCAAIISFNPADEKKLFKINVEGTANVVNMALQCAVKKMVYVSSVAALARFTNGQPITEKSELADSNGTSKYGYSKYLAELEVWRGAAEGLQVNVVNPSIILGAGNWNEGSSKIFKTVFNEFPYYSNGTTGFVDVADVATIMILLMNSDMDGQKFIVSATNATFKNVFTQIATAFNKKVPYIEITAFKAAIAWRVAAIKSFFSGTAPFITKETATNSLANVQFDNSKLLQALPHFKYKKIEQTITDICKEFLKTVKA